MFSRGTPIRRNLHTGISFFGRWTECRRMRKYANLSVERRNAVQRLRAIRAGQEAAGIHAKMARRLGAANADSGANQGKSSQIFVTPDSIRRPAGLASLTLIGALH